MSFFTADYTSQLAQSDPGAQFLLVNNDTVNPIYVSQTRPVNAQSNKIQPQASVTLTGLWYVSTLNNNITVECFIFPGGTVWDNPVGVQIALGALGLAKDTSVLGVAGQVAVTGAPPLVFKRVIDVLIGQNIPASSSITRPASGKFSLNQPGYEIALNVATLGGTAPVVSVELQWYDSAFGALIDDEIYYFLSGNINGHLIHGRGPSKGDQLVVIIRNYNATSAVTVSYTLLQTSRVFTREFWKTITNGAVAPVFPGFTTVGMNPAANTIAADSSSVAASTTKILALPLYTGTVRLSGIGGDTVVNNTEWQIQNATDQVAGQAVLIVGNGETGFAPTGPLSAYVPEVPLPRAQCTLNLINRNSTTGQTISTNIVTQEDRA